MYCSKLSELQESGTCVCKEGLYGEKCKQSKILLVTLKKKYVFTIDSDKNFN